MACIANNTPMESTNLNGIEEMTTAKDDCVDHRAFTERIAQLELGSDHQIQQESNLAPANGVFIPTDNLINSQTEPEGFATVSKSCDASSLESCDEVDLKQTPDCDIGRSDGKLNSTNSYRVVRRTLSECSSDMQCTVGILKYPRGWHRRTVSESGCDALIPCEEAEFDCGSAAESAYELISCGETDSHDERRKKSVRFSDHVAKTTFRINSSILGRKRKNQRRASRRHSSSEDGSRSRSPSTQTETSSEELNGQSSEVQSKLRQDSGYDSEESVKDGLDRPYVEQKWSEVKSKRNRRRSKRNGNPTKDSKDELISI